MIGNMLARGVILLLLSGCLPSLDFMVTPPDGSARDAGLGVDATARRDAPLPDAGDFACARPHALVAVEELSEAGGSGRVERIELATGRVCSPLTGRGELWPLSTAAVAIDRDHVAVAGVEGVQIVDARTDLVVQAITFMSDARIGGSFRIEHEGRERAGFALLGMVGVERLIIVDTSGIVAEFDRATSWPPIGATVQSVTQSPFDPTRLLVADLIGSAASEVDFVARTVTRAALVDGRKGVVNLSIAAHADGSTARLVWIGREASMTRLYFLDASATAGQSFFGPMRCSFMPDCGFAHAVPDPTRDLEYLAICDPPGGFEQRSLVRVAQGGACEVLLESSGLRPRMSTISVVE